MRGCSNPIEVSIVIPTCNRPLQVVAAVESVLQQGMENIEIIVVVDGYDPETHATLRGFSDTRLKVIELQANVGGAEARNTGVRAACGEWIAFLDDDDLWLPHKLACQLAAAKENSAQWPVISSRLVTKGSGCQWVQPLRKYDSQKPISEFLFCRSSFQDGPYALQTSTLMVKRELMLAVPFKKGLARHQDWDWILRAAHVQGVVFMVVEEPLVIYRTGENRMQDWNFSMQWGAAMREMFSPRAYAWFLATECASRARKSEAGLRIYAEIAKRFFRDGRPTMRSLSMLIAFLYMPGGLRRTARAINRSRYPRTLAAPSFEMEMQDANE